MVVGLGSGSTAELFVRALAERVSVGLKIEAVPTSQQTGRLADSCGIALTGLETRPSIDIDVDGADEIDPHLNLVKGQGGALLHEKIVALASRQFVVIADETKLVETLGPGRLIPVEIVEFGWTATRDRLGSLGAETAVRMEEDGPFRTDSGNLILDVTPPDTDIFNFAERLKGITGVVDHGVFLGIATMAIIGMLDGSVREVVPRRTRRPEPTAHSRSQT